MSQLLFSFLFCCFDLRPPNWSPALFWISPSSLFRDGCLLSRSALISAFIDWIALVKLEIVFCEVPLAIRLRAPPWCFPLLPLSL